MFRKILFSLLVLASVGSNAQTCPGLDVQCFDIGIPRSNLMDYYADIESGPDQYLVCLNQKVTVSPSLRVDYLNETDSYSVEKIDYYSYPYRDGTEIIVQTDQRATTDIDIPFEFCFFGNKWNKLSVHSNGVINFTDGTLYKGLVSDDTTGFTCTGGGCNTTDPMNPLPKGAAGSRGGPGWLNSISAPAFHHHVTTGPNGTAPAGSNPATGETWDYAKISYQVYGEAPCRVFVINFANMPVYALYANECSALRTNSLSNQVVLHETTNVIDVNVEAHYGCPLGDNGRSIIGINNPTGTVAYTAPGRNAEHFDVDHQRLGNGESWRFGPSGDPLWRLEWYANGEYVGDGFSQDVVIEGETEICSRLIIDGCEQTLIDGATVVFRPDIDLEDLEIEQQIVCDKNQNTFDLLTLNKIVIDNQGGATGNLLSFLYYNSEDDATNKRNRITQPRDFPINMGETPVWMRIEGRLEDCFEIVPITILKVPVEVKTPADVNLCEKYTLPVLTDDEFYYKLERLDEDGKFVVETLPQPNENQLIDRIGYYRVSIKKTNEYECEDVKSFILFVENCSFPKGISPNGDGDNDYLDLTYNNVQDLKVFNRYGKLVYQHGKGYKRQWSGQDSSGKILPSGTYFLNVKTKNSEYQDWIQLIHEVK